MIENNRDKKEKEKRPIELSEINFTLQPEPHPAPNPESEKKPSESGKEPSKEPSLEERAKRILGPEYGFKSEASDSSDKKIEKPQEKSEKKSESDTIPLKIPLKKSNEEPKSENKEGAKAQPKMLSPFSTILSSILILLLSVSIFLNIFLNKRMADMKKKALSNAAIAKKLVAERSKILEEYKPFKQKGEELTKKQEQVGALTTELAYTKKRFAELEGNLKKYADEVKDIASSKIEYYKAYVQGNENKEQTNALIANMEGQIETLNKKLDSIDDEYLKKESNYIYDMAFLYVKAEMYDEAIQYFKKFLEINNDDADIYYNLALIYEQVKKNTASAVYNYEKYLKLKPDAEDLYEVTMRINSLKRSGTKKSTSLNLQHLKINSDDLQY